ncbi:MAG: FmdB family zinc ribbon protein [Burkholderiales bacterium]
MPIYAYRCSECGHAKDVLQKMSDPVLTECPSCGAKAFTKQVTAAGFQLKGSGWYVTDFKGGDKAPAKSADDGSKVDGNTGTADKTDAAAAPAAKAETTAAPAAPAAAAPSAAPAPPAPATGSK